MNSSVPEGPTQSTTERIAHADEPGAAQEATATAGAIGPAPVTMEPAEISPDDDPAHSRNFALAVLYMVFMRTGWIFKTESIIMPAVLDAISGSGFMRGCLPMLNRLGQSVPPLLASDHIKNSPLKKRRLFTSTMTMAACFLTLAAIWWFTGGARSWWLPWLFLLIYGVFFASTGINQLLLYTITGKLVRVQRRGALSLVGTVIGATTAVIAAWVLLRLWLVDEVTVVSQNALPTTGALDVALANNAANAAMPPQSNFAMIFLFTGLAFVGAGVVSLFLRERPDTISEPRQTGKALFKSAWRTLQTDRNFRKLAIISGLFGMYLTLFPHYQSLGRDRLQLGLTALIPWVLAQNIGAALFSIPSGWIADRFGNRLVLQLMMLILCVAPILALALARSEAAGQFGFTIVFCLLGLTPVTMRILNNYTLEVTGSRDHPRYLSTLNIAMAVPPILLSSLFGALVDEISYEFVFSIVIGCVFVGWVMTFFIEEPRSTE